MFKQLFQCWRDRGQAQGVGRTSNAGRTGNNQHTLDGNHSFLELLKRTKQQNSCNEMCFYLFSSCILFALLLSSATTLLVLFLLSS